MKRWGWRREAKLSQHSLHWPAGTWWDENCNSHLISYFSKHFPDEITGLSQEIQSDQMHRGSVIWPNLVIFGQTTERCRHQTPGFQMSLHKPCHCSLYLCSSLVVGVCFIPVIFFFFCMLKYLILILATRCALWRLSQLSERPFLSKILGIIKQNYLRNKQKGRM